MPKSEKKVASTISSMGIEAYLPLQKRIRQWSDRKKKIEVPLFPNYVFIYALPDQRFKALKIKELVRFISFEGKPVVISEIIIDSLKKVLKGEAEVSNSAFYDEGMKVKINQGEFAGAEGRLIRRNGKTRLLIQIKALHVDVSVDISANNVQAACA
jgi:transcription antitermination factor NusG